MRKNRPSAFTLIELITVLAIFSVVVGTSIALLFQMFEFHDRFEERTVQDLRTDRLVRQFRGDVHDFGLPEAAQSDANILATWTTNEKTVVYTLTDGEFPEKKIVIRSETGQNTQNRTERFDLPDHATIWCTRGAGPHDRLVAMSIWTAMPGVVLENPAELNPFTRTLPEQLAGKVDPKYAGNWRTIIAGRPVINP